MPPTQALSSILQASLARSVSPGVQAATLADSIRPATTLRSQTRLSTIFGPHRFLSNSHPFPRVPRTTSLLSANCHKPSIHSLPLATPISNQQHRFFQTTNANRPDQTRVKYFSKKFPTEQQRNTHNWVNKTHSDTDNLCRQLNLDTHCTYMRDKAIASEEIEAKALTEVHDKLHTYLTKLHKHLKYDERAQKSMVDMWIEELPRDRKILENMLVKIAHAEKSNQTSRSTYWTLRSPEYALYLALILTGCSGLYVYIREKYKER